MMLYLRLSLSNTKTFCWLMRLFLSNSGNLRSRIVTTSCILRWPARVLISLVSPIIFVMMPFGKADILIIETFKPESKSTQKSLRHLIVPIVSAVQMVTGNSCFWNLDFRPMVVESRCVILDLIALIFKGWCVSSRGIGVVGDRYVQCGESWVYH